MRDLVKFIDDKRRAQGEDPEHLQPERRQRQAVPRQDRLAARTDPAGVSDAFATGGPVAAQATADAYVKQIVDSLHGKLKPGDVEALLGLHDLTATLKIAVDQASLATAQQMLEILTGLQGGETPWTASIKLALEAGTCRRHGQDPDRQPAQAAGHRRANVAAAPPTARRSPPPRPRPTGGPPERQQGGMSGESSTTRASRR
jgi:hypothetical protein